MRHLRLLIALPTLLAGCPSAPPTPPDAGGPPLPWPATVHDLRWLVGEWVASDGDGRCVVERWLPPDADTLMGVARVERRGAVLHRRLMRVLTDGDGLTLVAMTDGAAAGRFRVTMVTEGGLMAERDGPGGPRALIYRRAGEDALRATWIDGDGARDALSFHRAHACADPSPTLRAGDRSLLGSRRR